MTKNDEILIIYTSWYTDFINEMTDVALERFKLCLDELIKDNEAIEKTISKKMEIKENEIELIDKAILCLGIIEMNNEMAPRTVVIDECIRLTKKFSNPESYKFINASLDKI